MPRWRRPAGPLHVWQPDSREDEEPYQSRQRHLQVVSGSTSQRLSRGECGLRRSLTLISSRRSVFYVSLLYAGNGGCQAIHREAASSHQRWMNAGASAHANSAIVLSTAATRRLGGTRGITDLLDNKTHAATHRSRQDWSYYMLTWKRHAWHAAASWPGATHNPPFYSRVTVVAWL